MPPPVTPIIGQLYFDHPTNTMRRWNGKHWQETNLKEMNDEINNRKKPIMARAYDENKR